MNNLGIYSPILVKYSLYNILKLCIILRYIMNQDINKLLIS